VEIRIWRWRPVTLETPRRVSAEVPLPANPLASCISPIEHGDRCVVTLPALFGEPLSFSLNLGGYVDAMASADGAWLAQDRRKPRQKRVRLPTSFYVLMSFSLVFYAIAAVVIATGGLEGDFSFCIGTGIGLSVASIVMGRSIVRSKSDSLDARR
jgi:hypothetical protein